MVEEVSNPGQSLLQPNESVCVDIQCTQDFSISTPSMVKDILKQERELHRSLYENQNPLFESLVKVLEILEQDFENPRTATDNDLIPVEKVKSLMMHWNEMSPLESNHLRTLLYVTLSQLQRATLTMWISAESPSLTNQVREIVQKLLVFVRTTRSDLESILNLQRKVANSMWILNHVYHSSKRATLDYIDRLCLEMMQVNNVLLSSSIEQLVLLWPSMEYYAQERGSNPVHMGRENCEVGSQTSTTVSRLSRVSVEVFANDEDGCRPLSQDNVRYLGGIKVMHLALKEMLLEQQEWADSVSSRLRFRNGGDSADMGTESIVSILREAVRITSSLLGLGTNPEVIEISNYPDDVQETCPMFRMEFLNEKKFRETIDTGIIGTVNQLVSLNHQFLRLRCSLDKFTEEYVPKSESEEGAEHDQDIYASYFFYEDGYVFKEEDLKLPNGTSLTLMDDIPFADDAVGVEDGDVARKYTMDMFLQRFQRKIHVITDRVPLQDCRPLRLGEAAFRLEKLTDYALAQSLKMKEFWDRELEDRGVFEKRLKNWYGPERSWWRFVPSMDHLMYWGEKKVLRVLSSTPHGNILENLDRVAQGIVEVIPEGWESWGEEILKDATLELNESNLSIKHRAGIIEVGLLMLFPALYLLDIDTDGNVAYQHFSQSNYLYYALTIMFMVGPMVAEFISNVIVKLWRGKSYLSWKRLLYFDSLTLLPKSTLSLRYATYSMMPFDKDLCIFYSELNRLRSVHSKGQPKDQRCEALLIPELSYTMYVLNEKRLYRWKMNEALNESAPQLLLQMVFVHIQLVNGETVGYSTIIGMLVSLTTFAWSLHLYHHKMHYVGLENNFKHLHRATDFLANFLIVCGRFMAISCIAALSPMWFSVITFTYLGFRFIYLYFFSSERSVYRDLTESYPLWPIHRLFITPYSLNIWRVDLYDDVIYHFETLVLALSWPFLLDGGHPLADYRWAITATILVFNFVLLLLVLKYNASRHEPTTECGDGPPFPSWISLGKKLGAGKPVVERLGGMYTGD